MKYKFIIFLVASIAVCAAAGKWVFLPFCIMELFLIFAFTLAMGRRHVRWANVLNALLLFLYSAQLFIYHFTGEFISLLMLENIDMMSSLGDDLPVYILTALPFIVILSVPFRKLQCVHLPKLSHVGIATLVYIAVLSVTVTLCQTPLSPLSASAALCGASMRTALMNAGRLSEEERSEIISGFYRDSIPGTDRQLLPESDKAPNVILMFTEGMSAEVLDVYNDAGRELTPNIDALHSRSFVFDNYFNHTAATFRGLRGQIYSSYQYLGGYTDGDGLGEVSVDVVKDKLNVGGVSLVDILNDRGYNTCYVNPEPGLPQMVEYARSFGVDTLVSGNFGGMQSRTDRQIFEVLTEAVLEHEEKEEPYFIVFYNLGTHHGFDSPDIRYGDGTNPYLNKFHNYDRWLGEFLARMNEKGVFDHTLLVFTSDHASYPSPDFRETFDSDREFFIDAIPLMLYTKGIIPGRHDAAGRNSLDLTPTLLDILGVEDYGNLFVGTTLFREPETDLSYVAAIGDDFFSTKGGYVRRLKRSDELVDKVKKYYRISLND